MKAFAAALLSAALLPASLQAQSTPPPQDQPPKQTFRSAVDVVRVDVSVLERDGRPVADLEAADFALSVDGKSRRIASAEFVAVSRETERIEPPSDHSSNAGAAGGRLIMLLIDQGNIGSARGKFVIDAASRFVSRLNRADRVALGTIPGAGPQVEFTSNHLLVRSMLQNIVGQATAEHGARKVGIAEAVQLERGDERKLTELIERECPGFLEPAEVEKCRTELRRDARLLYLETRNRTRDTLLSLRAVMERLAAIPGPKSVIFVSEGVLLDRDYGDVAWLGPLAARAHATLSVLQLDPPEFDAAASRISQTREADIELAQEGLAHITGLAGGTVIRVINKADFAFERVALELSGYYLLSFEPEPGDRDGRPHKIKVSLPGRRNVEVRSRGEFAVDAAPTRSDQEVLAETLRSPLLATEIGLTVTTYTFRDPQSEKLRVVLASEIDRSRNEPDTVAIAYALADERGNVVSSQVEPRIESPVHAATRRQSHVGAILIPQPGLYLVKVAVLDSSGRRGSVQHNFRAQLTPAGQIRVTDLMIAENPGRPGAGITPAVGANFSADMLQGYVELYSEAPEALRQATAVIEVAATEDGQALDGTEASFSEAQDSPNRRVAEAAVPIALLPPGQYVARAVISIGGRKAGQVVRPFRIVRTTTAAPAVATEPARAPGVDPPIAFSSRIDRFDRASVLTPAVVGFFLNRMNVGNRVAAAPAPAIAAVKAGNFDAALEALKGAPPNQLAPVFLTGLALYAKGELEPAAAKFRESLRLDSEFFPAAFYLGSCYAAGGRDQEAIGAWQTSLITESSAPFIYTLLADAMLRLKQSRQALDILNEAATLWPGSPDVQMRLGAAFAQAGAPADSLRAYDAYLAKRPDDHERLLAAMRVIYDVRSSGRSIGTADEDRQRFSRYAAAYAAAGGPEGATVEQWRRIIER